MKLNTKNASSFQWYAAFNEASQTFFLTVKVTAATLMGVTLLLIASIATASAQETFRDPVRQKEIANQPSVLKTASGTTVAAPVTDAKVADSTVAPENLAVVPNAQRTLTQSVSQAITGGSVACGPTNSGTTNSNSYWRTFNVAANSLGGFNVQSVSFGIEVANAPNNATQPVNVRLYAQTAGAFPGGTRVQIGSTTTQIANQSGTIVTVPITATVPPAATEFIVEINSPGITTVAGSSFFIGSNGAGQTAPSYISAPACSINTPTPTGNIGYPNMHIVLNVTGTDGVGIFGTKTVSGSPFIAGNNATYTVTLTNSGALAQPDNPTAEFVDVLPTGLTLVSATATSGTVTTSGGTVTFDGGIAAGGSVTITIIARINADAGGQLISNQGTIRYDNDANGVSETTASTDDPNVAGTANPTNFTATASANLSITKTDTPDPVAAGANLTYTLTVGNSGPSNAANVSLSDTLPANTTFVSLTPAAGFSCTNLPVGAVGTVTCTNPSLAPGGAGSVFTLVVKVGSGVTSGTTITNTATVSAAIADPNTANNSATATTTVTVSADLAVTSLTSTPDPATAGTNLTYTFSVANNGPSDALNVIVTDNLPAGTTFVSTAQTNGPAFNCTTPAVGSGGTVTCTRSSLVSGTSATFTLVVRVNSDTANGASLPNTVTISSATTDPNATNNSASTSTSIATATDLSVVMNASNPVSAGGNLIYTIRVRNDGPSDAQNVVLLDQIPAGTTYQSISFPANWKCRAPSSARGNVRCTKLTFEAGDEAVFALRVRVAQTAPIGTAISNQVTVESDTTETNSNNNASSNYVTVNSSAGGNRGDNE